MAWPATTTTNTPGSTLNFRSGPSTTQSVIGSIPNGTSITLTGDAQNGWYPVTYNGQSGWVSATYVNAPAPTTPPPTTTPPPPSTSPAPPPAIPHTQEGSNPFYSPGSTYGSYQNWYTTPLVSQNTNNFDAEYEKFVTDSGFGGVNRIGDTARSLIDRAKSGYTAAQMNNPGLTGRGYLNEMLGPNFLQNAINAMTPQQRGESYALNAPRSRWTPR